eukprot:g14864.t1
MTAGPLIDDLWDDWKPVEQTALDFLLGQNAEDEDEEPEEDDEDEWNPVCQGRGVLHLAVTEHDLPAIETLIEGMADVNGQDLAGFTPLMWAAGRDSADGVKMLLDCEADLLVKAARGQTAMTFALTNGCNAIVDILDKHQAILDAEEARRIKEKGEQRDEDLEENWTETLQLPKPEWACKHEKPANLEPYAGRRIYAEAKPDRPVSYFSFRDYLSCKLNFVKWPPCGTDPETSRTKKASWLGRCCRRLKSTGGRDDRYHRSRWFDDIDGPGEEPDLEAGAQASQLKSLENYQHRHDLLRGSSFFEVAGVPPAVSKTHSKISRGNSVSFASAPSSTSANEELMSHAVPFDPEEFLRPVCQSDLVDRFYSKLAAEYEAAAAASASGLAEEGLLPWRDSGAAFSLSPTTKSENMASSRSWNVGPADSSSYAATRRASSLGDASAFGRLDAEDTEPSHAAPEVQLEHNPERSPPARPSRPSRSAPLISLESIDDVNVEVIRSPSGQVKQKHLVFAMVEEKTGEAMRNHGKESPTRNRLADGAGPLPPREDCSTS